VHCNLVFKAENWRLLAVPRNVLVVKLKGMYEWKSSSTCHHALPFELEIERNGGKLLL
jgi:hypothetical protein